jgi:hypothetical protein
MRLGALSPYQTQLQRSLGEGDEGNSLGLPRPISAFQGKSCCSASVWLIDEAHIHLDGNINKRNTVWVAKAKLVLHPQKLTVTRCCGSRCCVGLICRLVLAVNFVSLDNSFTTKNLYCKVWALISRKFLTIRGSIMKNASFCKEQGCVQYSKLLKERHHRGSDGAVLANFPLFQEYF